MDGIDAKKPDPIRELQFKIKKDPDRITTPEQLFRQLRAYEELLSKSTDSLPYRHQIQLNAINESLAVLNGNAKVRQKHIDTIARLVNWINYDFKEI